MNRSPVIAFALAFLLLVWGYSWVFLKMGLDDSGPFTFAALRTLVAAIFLLIMLLINKKPFLPVRTFDILSLGLVQTALFVGLSQWSLVSGGVGKTAILVFTMPFWVLIFSWFLLHERIVGRQWLAVFFAALGLVLVLTPWQTMGSIKSQYIALGAGVAWGLSTVMVKHFQHVGPLDILNLTAWQMLFGSFLLGMVALIVGEQPVVWSTRFVSVLAFTGVVATGIGWLVWIYLLQHLSANVAAMSILAVPVIAIFAAGIHFGERPTFVEVFGMAFILGALWLLALIKRTPKDVLIEPL